MTAIVDRYIIDSQFIDKRIKLIDCKKEMVVYWREQGMSQRELAKLFKVSRRTIQFTLDPEKKVDNLKARELRGGGKIYYDKDKQREYMQVHRQHKKDHLALLKEITS